MASFTETATLKVINQSSKEIRAINKDLLRLGKTTDGLKKTLRGLGSVKINTAQITQANRQLLLLGNSAKNVRKELQLSGSIRLQSINTAVTRLKALQTQANATAQAIAKIGDGVRTPRMPGSGRPGRPANPNSPQNVTVQYGGLQGFLNGFVSRLGSTIESSIISGFAKGGRATDLAQNRQRILGFTPEQRAANNQTATDIAGRNRGFSRAQILGVMGEITPSVGNNPEATAFITEAVLDYSKALMAAGATSDEATDNLQKLSKAMGMTSTLLDSQGKFDKDATQKFIDVLVQETITGGREMTPELIAQLAKYSRTTGKTLDQEGWRTLLFLGEDYGSSAGVGLNQMIKQLTGERVQKKQLANQIEYGITGSKEIETGTVGGKKSTERVSTGVQDETLLRTNPAAWVRQVLMPIMQKNSIDPTDNVAVAKFAGEITSDRTATDILTTLVTNIGEVEQRRKIAQDRGNVDLDAIMNESLVSRWDDATTQLISAAGETANAFKTVLIPALNFVGDNARAVAAFLAGGDGQGDPLVAATVAGGAGVASLAAYKAGSSIMGGFGLKGSAVALDASAAALSRAAVALGASGTAGGLPGGDIGGKKGPGFWGKALKAAGWAGIITTGAVIADETLNDGKLTKQGGDNITMFLALQDALMKVVNDRIAPKEPDAVNTGNETQARLTETEAAIAQVKADIASAGPDAGAWVIAKQNELANLQMFATTLRDEHAVAATNMRASLESGSATIVAGIDGSASSFGATVLGALIPGAGAFGSAAAAAFNSQVAPVVANIKVAPGPDTGQNANGAR